MSASAKVSRRRLQTGAMLKRDMKSSEWFNGAPGEIRTPDPQIRSLVLYPAELRARGFLIDDQTRDVNSRLLAKNWRLRSLDHGPALAACRCNGRFRRLNLSLLARRRPPRRHR